MSYAKSVLQPGETIIAAGRLHWIIYSWAIVLFVAGIVLLLLEYVVVPDFAKLITATTVIFGALALGFFVYAWFIRWITEFAVTNRRVIYKRGFVWRETEEMNMDKVETVDIDQTIPGRILNYGSVRVTGTGGTNNIEIRRIAAPFTLRNAIIAK